MVKGSQSDLQPIGRGTFLLHVAKAFFSIGRPDFQFIRLARRSPVGVFPQSRWCASWAVKCKHPPHSNSMFTQLYEKSSYDVRNCFIISVDQIGLEPMTSRL